MRRRRERRQPCWGVSDGGAVAVAVKSCAEVNVAVVVARPAQRLLMSANMRTAGTSKVLARRRARDATRRANEARAAREKANIENAATYMVAKGRLGDIDAWETERLATVTEQVRMEADKRRERSCGGRRGGQAAAGQR